MKSKSKKDNSTLIGRGVLNWQRMERVSDRYGAVHLDDHSGEYLGVEDIPAGPIKAAFVPVTRQRVGKTGKLIATVLEARKSGHIGDLFRGISPRVPKVGQKIELGHGALFYEQNRYDPKLTEVGLCPPDGRRSDWLNPRALYDCHDQTVELRFHAD